MRLSARHKELNKELRKHKCRLNKEHVSKGVRYSISTYNTSLGCYIYTDTDVKPTWELFRHGFMKSFVDEAVITAIIENQISIEQLKQWVDEYVIIYKGYKDDTVRR